VNLTTLVTGRLATRTVMAVTAIFLARVLGTDGYGLFAAVMAVALILQTVATVGLPLVEIRFLSPLWQKEDRDPAITLASTIWTARQLLAWVVGLGAVIWFSQSAALALELWVCLVLGAMCLFRSAFEATRSLFLPLAHPLKHAGFEFMRGILTLPVVLLAYWAGGLNLVFLAIGILFACLFLVALKELLSIAPLRPSRFRWSELRAHQTFATRNYVGALSTVVQAHLAVYLVANYVASAEAAFLALSVQLVDWVKGLQMAGRRSLMPVLSEFEEEGDHRRVRLWASILLRYGAAATCMIAMGWALLGRALIHGVLSPSYDSVYLCGTLMLVGGVFFTCATTCTGILYVKGRAGLASANSVVYALVTLVGILIALTMSGADVTVAIAWVYLAASLLHWILAYLCLGVAGKMWLSLRRATYLLLPLLLIWPITQWEAGLGLRLPAAVLLVVLYGSCAVFFRLLPWTEIEDVLKTIRQIRSSRDRLKAEEA